MADDGWNPWKLAAIGMALVMVAALITGLVVANWTGPVPLVMLPAAPAPETTQVRLPPGTRALPSTAVPPASLELVALSEAIVAACNEYAAKQTEQLDQAKALAHRTTYAICLRARLLEVAASVTPRRW